MVMAELIDEGEPFLSNAAQLQGILNLDFSVLSAVSGRKISIGEFIAHGISISRLEHVNDAMSKLLGKDFLALLRQVTDRWANEVDNKPLLLILTNPEEVYADVKRVFEIRHIVCHELASGYSVEFTEVERMMSSVAAFLRAARECVSETMYPGAPLTQSAMNEDARDRLSKVNVQLDQLLDSQKAILGGVRAAAFEDAQLKWENYRDSWSKFVADDFDGGSIWPLFYANEAEALALRRILDLEAYANRLERALG